MGEWGGVEPWVTRKRVRKDMIAGSVGRLVCRRRAFADLFLWPWFTVAICFGDAWNSSQGLVCARQVSYC